MQRVHRLFTDERGGVLIIGALALPLVIGVASLVTEYGLALITKAQHQRVADLAAYSGALAYTRNQSEGDMRSAAARLAVLNGVEAGKLTVALVDSPRTSGARAVSVTINDAQPLFLAQVLNLDTNLKIASAALAEVGTSQQAGCMLALSGTQTGITLSGGTQVTSKSCVVVSNSTITLPCGTRITAIGATYNSTAPTICQWQPTLVTPEGTNVTPVKTATPDPLAGNKSVATAVARIKTVKAMTAPAAPAVASGTNIDFGWGDEKTKAAVAAAGCTATWAQPLWTVNCGGKATLNFGSITIGGGLRLAFNTQAGAGATYNFSGSITNSGGSRMEFGPGTYNIARGIVAQGGTTTIFGAGIFRIGRGESGCNGGAQVSICNMSTLTFDGPSTFELAGGFMNTGGSTLTLGSGTTNSYRLGASSTGEAIIIGGGSKTFMADATGANSVFEAVGHVNGGGGGGSCLVIPAARQHDIAGNFLASGNVYLGAGIYTIDGYFALGANGGGGGASCNGTTSVTGNDVSLVISGEQTPTGGSCGGYAFCIAAGYSGVRLVAPTSGTMAKLAVIGPQDAARTAGALFTEGGSNGVVSGAFYFPNGPLVMNGGASTGGLSDGCFHPIASRITLSGGTSQVSECIGGAASGGGKVAIVQ